MPTPSSPESVGDPNLSEPISELVANADLIVVGTVESVEGSVTSTDEVFPAQGAVVRVTEVLKGEAPSTIAVVKPEGTWYYLAEQAEDSYDAHHEGVFAVKAAGDSYELFGYAGVLDDAQKFVRVLAGLPENAPSASEEQLSAWAAQADIIVFARARGKKTEIILHTPRADFSSAGALTPIEVLKGEMPGPLDVVQGPQPDVPGGIWGFPVTKEGRTGVYFIDTSSGTPTVINTTDPFYVNERLIPLD